MSDSSSQQPVNQNINQLHPPTLSVTSTEVDSTFIKYKLTRRIYQGLDYLSLYTFIIAVYGGALLTDYLLFSLMWWLLSEDVRKYPLVAQGFDYAKIGLSLLFITSAVVHGCISTYSQIKLDIKFAKEDKEKK